MKDFFWSVEWSGSLDYMDCYLSFYYNGFLLEGVSPNAFITELVYAFLKC